MNNLKDITFNPNDNDENIKEDYIEWKLDNFEQLLNEKRKNSHKFTAVGHKWYYWFNNVTYIDIKFIIIKINILTCIKMI